LKAAINVALGTQSDQKLVTARHTRLGQPENSKPIKYSENANKTITCTSNMQ